MELIIKKAGRDEIDKIAAIYNEAIDWLDSQEIRQWKRNVYPTRQVAQAALEEGSLYCCCENDKIVGTFILNEFQPEQYQTLDWKFKEGKALVLHTLVVKPTETGKGVGKYIMGFVLDYAKNNCYPCIRLDAFPGNKTARRLYQSFGFEYAGKVFFEYKESGYEWYDCYERLV